MSRDDQRAQKARRMKSLFLDKLIERLDKIDPQNIQTQFLRLMREKGLLEAVLNALQESLIVIDGKGRIVYSNSAASSLLGIDLETAGSRPISFFLKEVDWERVLELDEKEWSKLLSREIEIAYPRHRFLNFYVMPLPLDEERGRGAIVILRDITGERERELNVLQSERLNAITLLAAGVAHEIGNPLNSLHIHLQLMERELKAERGCDIGRLSNQLAVAKKEVERLNQVIAQFLKAVRPSNPQMAPANIGQLIEEAVSFIKHELENRDIIVDVTVADDMPLVSVDANQIKQALFNIMKNALQAMPSGGILTINAFHDDKSAGISFKDTGVGISAEDLSAIFESYRTTKKEGTGLGLMIVQRIVREHGGEIEVESKPGAGTTFTVLLPLDSRRVRLLEAAAKTSARGEKGDER